MNKTQVITTFDGVEVYKNDIEIAIDEACEDLDITDLLKEGQARWKAVCYYVGQKVFPDRNIFKNKNKTDFVKVPNNIIPTNCNRYDYNKIDELYNYYVQMSRKYNKLISVVAFSLFCNIPYETIRQWGTDGRERGLGTTGSYIFKKLHDDREDSLKDKAIDSGNVMGVFQVGRREFQWDMPGVKTEQSRQIKTAEQLPQLGENSAELIDNSQPEGI